MKSIRVALKENSYSIIIGERILSNIANTLLRLRLGNDFIVITDSVVKRLYEHALVEALKRKKFNVKVFAVSSGEKSKSTEVAFKLMKDIARYDALKKISIVAFGGGVIGDLAGFVAAVYKRGIPYIQVPTTLLAQIDSAIGGKVAVDLPVGKNLVGAFYQPKLVFSEIALLSSLPKREIRNGLAEAVKYGVIYDSRLFHYIAKNYAKILAADSATLNSLVYRCSQIKAQVVERDEKEIKGIRTILNFGHTVGHSIEAAGGYKLYHHGEAIALGMRVAAEISCQLGMFARKEAESLNKVLTQIGLPQWIQGLNSADILNVMRHDKKFLSGKNRFVLVEKIGKVKIVEGVPSGIIKKSIQRYIR